MSTPSLGPGAKCRAAGLPPANLPSQSWRARSIRWLVRRGLTTLLRLVIRLEVVGLENVPTSGPFIVASNHSSHLDGALLVLALERRRRVRIAAAKDYFFRRTLQSWISRNVLDLIPVERRLNSRAGLRLCAASLAGDEPAGPGLVVFPEGTRSQDGSLQPLKPGIGILAVETGAPLVPAWIEGTFPLMPRGTYLPRPGRVCIVFGQPLQPPAEPAAAGFKRRRQLWNQFTQAVDEGIRGLASAAR